jgi:anti-anti-sigma regulatory factor
MPMHFVSHPWQVEDVADGTVVKLTEPDLRDTELADELLELALENGHPRLYLDLLAVGWMPSTVAARLFRLDRRLRASGGCLILTNLASPLCEALQARGA